MSALTQQAVTDALEETRTMPYPENWLETFARPLHEEAKELKATLDYWLPLQQRHLDSGASPTMTVEQAAHQLIRTAFYRVFVSGYRLGLFTIDNEIEEETK